ncbi:MAG: RagB/SusD family nutrient uptake outer membrane protein [Rikenellaceae bacterium]|nr:RagB/SusD family nutrient uptake outer membrane protein [Rikenellaceae bacterium]
MKKIVLYTVMLLGSVLTGCSDFLDKTPNKSGSAYIYHMDQLEGLIGNPSNYRTGYCWSEAILRGDAVEYSSYYVVRTAASGDSYYVWAWDNEFLETGNMVACTWTPVWNNIYTFNTVLEYMDQVEQTTPSIRKQAEGEALFGRAYYHFIALVQYALWDETAPGIGYRTNTAADDIPARETVGYTLERIYADLDAAQEALTAVDRTVFQKERNFRPTVPTVQALRARIALYRGNYDSALANATAALNAYDVLLDFQHEELYQPDLYDIHVLDPTNTAITETIQYKFLTRLMTDGGEKFWKYDEFLLSHYSDLYFYNRNLPISQSYYDLFDHKHDARWKTFYDNNYIVYQRLHQTIEIDGVETARCFTWEDQQGTPEANRHVYLRFSSSTGSSGKYYILGLTTAEMYLIQAECLARVNRTEEAAEVLRTLRRTRFTDMEAAENIGGSVQEALDERAREMSELWRFYDIKRLNGAEKANISITRTVLTSPTDIHSTQTLVIAPDDPRWAIPIDNQQLILMGWEQN